jgi:hypothetical protein
MRNGTGTSFVGVPILADNGLITKAYLHDIETAIKQRTPIAGDNINIKVTDGSYIISAVAREIALTACSNGTPYTITVFGK